MYCRLLFRQVMRTETTTYSNVAHSQYPATTKRRVLLEEERGINVMGTYKLKSVYDI